MAKGKHAAALFEVISKGKKRETSRGSILRTPSWWFKNRTDADAQQPAPPPAEAAPTASHDSPAPPADPAPAVHQASHDEPPVHDPTDAVAPADVSATAAPASPAAAPPPAQPALSVDPDRKQIALRLSYTTAGIGAFALLITVSLAYVIGRQVSSGPAPAIAARTTEQIRQDDPQPQVLDITRGGNVSSIPPAQQPQARPQTLQTVQAPPAAQAPATVVEDDGPRTIGLNYIIIQSYRDQEMARRYAQLLVQEGIPCTVEQDLPNWSQGGPWYSIVGTRGFSRIRNSPDYDAYVQSIRRVNDRHGLTGFRRFDPQPYHWKGTR